MILRRVLRYINFAIGAALVAFLAAAYWFAWRPLPMTSGELRAPVNARAVVSRDALGVPHILAANQADVLFLQGYATAQDRLFQMDLMRRVAAGELAEVVGRSALESDREFRRLGFGRLAEEQTKQLPAQDRAVLAAYARGVNYFLETHRGRLPLEFTMLRYDPRPWTIADSLLVFLNMVNTLEGSWRGELRREAMLAGGDPAKIDFLYPGGGSQDLRPGSNAWAVSGALTASRRPILAGDPHLDFSIPSIWHMVHLRGPRLNVTGVTVPGVPGVLIGHNDRIAWSITSLEADCQDLYVEKLNLANGLYEFAGGTERARLEREVIRVKGGASDSQIVWVTRHGPIVSGEGGRLLALRWGIEDAAGFQFPVLDLDRAQDWESFRSALARLPAPAVNVVYADSAGNIGYQAAGRLPVRRGFDGSVPADGTSGKAEWDGVISFEKLPTIFNPPSGMIISANQSPFPADFPFQVGGDFAAPYRFRQIRDRLRARQGLKAEDMLSIQTDVYSGFSHFLARAIVAAYARKSSAYPGLAEPVAMLRDWNGQMSVGQSAPMIATLTYFQLRTAIARRASQAKQDLYAPQFAPAVIEKLLRERPSGWLEDYDKTLLDCLTDAVQSGRRLQGRDIAKWDYGVYNRVVLNNPVAGRLPVVGKYFNIGEVLMGGSPETPLQRRPGTALGPSMRMVVDFGNLDKSLQNIAIGESGQILSRHYRDQWDSYQAGRSFPMQVGRIEAVDTLTFLPATAAP